MIRVLVALGLAGAAWCATADDLLKQVDGALSAAERRDPSSGVRAEAIAALVPTPGLAPAERRRLRAALAEAWLDARRWEAATKEAAALAQEAEATPAERESAALTWLTAWAGAGTDGDPLLAVAALGVDSPRVAIRALTLRAQRKLAAKDRTALDDADGALKLLATAEPAERVPLLAWRITAMEALGADAKAVQTWLAGRGADPAVGLLGGGSGGQGLTGRAAPALRAARVDGTPGNIDLETWRAGKPVAVVFIASWSDACATIPASLPTLKRPVLLVALDGPETVAGIPAWCHRLGVTAPVVGEGKGWDGELDEAWGVEQIPTVILLDAAGKVEAVGVPKDLAATPVGQAPGPVPATAKPSDEVVP